MRFTEAYRRALSLMSVRLSESSLRQYNYMADNVVRMFGDFDIGSVDVGTATGMARRMLSAGYSPYTVSMYMGFLARVAELSGHRAAADAFRYASPRKTPKRRIVIIPPEGIRCILEKARLKGHQAYVALRLMYEAGLRVGELLSLRARDFDPETCGVYLVPEKKRVGEHHYVPVSRELCRLLRDMTSSMSPDEPISPYRGRSTIYRLVSRLAEECGYPGAGPHDFSRHCLDAETLVYTPDGPLRLGDAYTGARLLAPVPGMSGEDYSEATVVGRGAQPVYMVEAGGRLLWATGEHLVAVDRGVEHDWKRVADLEPGKDWLLGPTRISPREPSEPRARGVMLFVLGLGLSCASPAGMNRIATRRMRRGMAERLAGFLSEHGLQAWAEKGRLYVRDKGAYSLLVSEGYTGSACRSRRPPLWVYTAGREALWFLAGALAYRAAGTRDGTVFRFTEPRMAADIQVLMLHLGLRSWIRRKGHSYVLYADPVLETFEPFRRLYGIVAVTDTRDYVERGGVASLRVNRVEYAGHRQVYDVETGLGALVADGFYTHNSRATNLLRAGHDIYRVAQLMRHRSIETTTKYLHLAREDLRGVVEEALDEE